MDNNVNNTNNMNNVNGYDGYANLKNTERPDSTKLNGFWVCECSEVNPNTNHYCKNCGKPRPAMQKTKRSVGKLIWYCPTCGRKNDSMFCPDCGTPRPTEKQFAVYCDACGWPKSASDEPRFCPDCGKPLRIKTVDDRQ